MALTFLLWGGCCFPSPFSVFWVVLLLVVLSSSPSFERCCFLPFACGWCCFPPCPSRAVLLWWCWCGAASSCVWCCLLLAPSGWCCSLHLLIVGTACFLPLPCGWCCFAFCWVVEYTVFFKKYNKWFRGVTTSEFCSQTGLCSVPLER